MNKTISTITLSVALLSTAGCKPFETVPDPATLARIENSQVETDVQQSFNDIKQYWLTKQLGAASVSLRIITGKQVAYCESVDARGAYDASDLGLPQYCKRNKTILFNEQSVSDVVSFANDAHISSKVMGELMMAHEFGHGVQQLRGEDMNHPTSAQELRAECYGGVALAHLGSSIIQAEAQVVPLLADDSHGTSTQRYDAFVRGATTGHCD